jgi:hypothetical protein
VNYDHHRVTPEGRAIGFQTATLVEPTVQALARQGEADDRCKSCAGTYGTVPNGCLQTQSDLIKAITEGVPFGCHVNKGMVCHAWYAGRIALRGKVLPAAWDFSPPDEPAKDPS